MELRRLTVRPVMLPHMPIRRIDTVCFQLLMGWCLKRLPMSSASSDMKHPP